MDMLTSMNKAIDYMEEHMGSRKEENRQMIIVNHGNVPADAELTVKMIRDRFGFENIMVGNVGSMIGAHTGPSIVVIAFLGEERS